MVVLVGAELAAAFDDALVLFAVNKSRARLRGTREDSRYCI